MPKSIHPKDALNFHSKGKPGKLEISPTKPLATARDLSLALGKTGFIHPILSIWVPILAISLYCSIGLIQINEK